MLSTRKHIASFFILIVFFMLAVSSSRVNKLHYGAFAYNNNIEGDEYGKTYLVDNSGTKIYGREVSWKSGLLTKNQIRIDNDKYKIAEIRGYMDHGVFYGRLKNEYIKRIVHGKLNVYVAFTIVTSTDYDPHSHSPQRIPEHALTIMHKGGEWSANCLWWPEKHNRISKRLSTFC